MQFQISTNRTLIVQLSSIFINNNRGCHERSRLVYLFLAIKHTTRYELHMFQCVDHTEELGTATCTNHTISVVKLLIFYGLTKLTND